MASGESESSGSLAEAISIRLTFGDPTGELLPFSNTKCQMRLALGHSVRGTGHFVSAFALDRRSEKTDAQPCSTAQFSPQKVVISERNGKNSSRQNAHSEDEPTHCLFFQIYPNSLVFTAPSSAEMNDKSLWRGGVTSVLFSLSSLCPVFRNHLYPLPLGIVTRADKGIGRNQHPC
jgi:hypothetical protein